MGPAGCPQRHSATAVSRPFLPQISPIFRHFSPVLSVVAPGSRTAQNNGGKTAENGRETAEKQWAGSGVGIPSVSGVCRFSIRLPIHQESVGGDHSFLGRFRPLRNRPSVFWCHFLESWRQDGENREKTRKNGAKMGEIWPKKKSAGCPSIIEGSVK